MRPAPTLQVSIDPEASDAAGIEAADACVRRCRSWGIPRRSFASAASSKNHIESVAFSRKADAQIGVLPSCRVEEDRGACSVAMNSHFSMSFSKFPDFGPRTSMAAENMKRVKSTAQNIRLL